MPIEGPVPGWMLSLIAAATLFAVMFDLGLAIVPGEFRWVVQRPMLLLKALFAVLVAVPVLALVVTWAVDLPRPVEIGIVLMAISPGAPVALRRSMGAGGHRTFAPALQIAVALLAVVSMPLSIAVLNEYYSGQAVVDPLHLARQVFFAQLLPLALGMATNRLAKQSRGVARTEAPSARKRVAGRAPRAGADRHLARRNRRRLARRAGHRAGDCVGARRRTPAGRVRSRRRERRLPSAARRAIPDLRCWSRRSTTPRRRLRPQLSPIC